jgi:glycosyltransferase involved in cell wall biosynthesis
MWRPGAALKRELRALILSPEAPYPAVGGGPLRSAALIEYLARRGALDAVVFREPGAPDPRAGRLAELARRIHVIQIPFHSRRPAARLWRNLGRWLRAAPPLVDRFSGFEAPLEACLGAEQYDVAVIEHFWCAPYGRLLARHARQLVLDLHNIESVLHASYARIEPWPVSAMHRKFASACRKLERQLLPAFSAILVPSERDAAEVRRLAPSASVYVYPNTIPEVAVPDRREEDAVAFSGNLAYPPNIAAVRFFAGEIWPQLRRRWPALEWWLIGKQPECVRRLVAGDARVRILGPVEDALAWLARAQVAVVPLQAGSGTRVKILEAWAAATPVVSTTLGAEGLPAVHGRHLLVADRPGEFAAAVSSLLESTELRRQIGAAGRALYQERFTWPAGWRDLENFFGVFAL